MGVTKSHIIAVLCMLFFMADTSAQTTHSIAREWNEVLLESIRKDKARPTVHARNLFHTSVIMFDAFAVYDEEAEPFMLDGGWGDNEIDFYGVDFVEAGEERNELVEQAINYGMYRLLSHRFAGSPGASISLPEIEGLFLSHGGDLSYTSVDYISDGGAALGNFLAQHMIAFGLQDGSNEVNGYANEYYLPSNPELFIELEAGNPGLVNPNSWQPINLSEFIGQSGIASEQTPEFLGPEWGNVTSFGIPESERSVFTRNGDEYSVWMDQGAPPLIDVNTTLGFEDPYQWGFSMVLRWSAHMDPADGVMMDISPASIGNLSPELFELDYEDYDLIYNWEEGGDVSEGHAQNPFTGSVYEAQTVYRGDYSRVLAEFWADGPDSETPPGHWFVLLNYVSDHPDFTPRWHGEGAELDKLEWDILSYFTLGGTVHDAAIASWSHKGWYDYLRPVSALRWMADRGQCTNPNIPNYNIAGIPLFDGWSDMVGFSDPLFPDLADIGKAKVRAWKGSDYIVNPESDVAGVDWILAENWWPYQRPSFVTPPFAGYTSGHSTFSRAAAEVMTVITGDPFFPGGMGEFLAPQNEFLVFEDGPSQDVVLQWATYRDASDQCSLSRIWGGIHPPADDIPGRRLGLQVATYAISKADYFINLSSSGPTITCAADLSGNGSIGVEDMLSLLSSFGTTVDEFGSSADFNSDGIVGVDDMLAFLSLYGTTCP